MGIETEALRMLRLERRARIARRKEYDRHWDLSVERLRAKVAARLGLAASSQEGP